MLSYCQIFLNPLNTKVVLIFPYFVLNFMDYIAKDKTGMQINMFLISPSRYLQRISTTCAFIKKKKKKKKKIENTYIVTMTSLQNKSQFFAIA